MQNDFAEFKQKSEEMVVEAKNSHQMLEKAPWIFIALGVALSAACTYYLGEQGLRKSDFYQRTIGAENTALLVVGVMEGSLIALIYGMTTYLKSKAQRALAKVGINVLKVILCLNVLAAFAMWVSSNASLLPIVELYAKWGTPLAICGALWFWPKILNLRHQDIMREAALEHNAHMAEEWRDRHKQDQRNYLDAYASVWDSPAMTEVQRRIAEQEAVAQLAKDRNIPIDVAEHLFLQAKNVRDETATRRLQFFEQRQLPAGATASSDEKPPMGFKPPKNLSSASQSVIDRLAGK